MRSLPRSLCAAGIAAAFLAAGCAAADDASEEGAEAAGDETPPADGEDDALVARVIDGDSVELEIDGEVVEARLIGINAPELADCQGDGAKEALRTLSEGRRVRVRSFGEDRFGRLLVDLTIDGASINLSMVSTGWALGQHNDEHGAAELWVEEMDAAAKAGLGMWNLPACPPAGAEVVIADIEPDPPRPDDEVLEAEWIELENQGEAAVDLTGWAVRDESTSNRFVFPDGVLEPGARLRLRTGCGTDTTTERYWCSPGGVWSNRGETALLLGPSGSIEDWQILP